MSQVRNHLESQDRQYSLAEKANVLGFKSVTVIDEDLGARDRFSRAARIRKTSCGCLLRSCRRSAEAFTMHPALLGIIETGIT